MTDNNLSRRSRWRLAFFFLSAISIFGAMYVLFAVLNTLRRLDLVESERDTWQRPADVLRALDIREGSVVVDLGSGAGYFALKISTVVGSRGKVLAVDVRKLSLSFLWLRAALRSPHNIQIIAGQQDDPRLPEEAADAVLIANTYHELANPPVMLQHSFQALRRGGRLVIVDRGSGALDPELAANLDHSHRISLDAVEEEVRKTGFETIGKQDRFIDRPPDDLWWLLIARRP